MQNDYNNVAYSQYSMGYPQQMHQHHYPTSPNTVNHSSFEYEHTSAGPSTLVDRRRSPTARRLSPGDLIPHDAPTQSRRYITPSATSRRDVPSSFHRRPSYSRISDEEEDELQEEPLGPNATEQEKIEFKRRQNTLAARRSRKRKLQQQLQLQEQVETLTKEKEIWKTRALTLRQLLLTHGILCPDFKD